MKALLPPQVVRLVGLTIAIVCSYFIARHFLVPDSFGQYGWFRGDALKEIAAREPSFAGKAACAECHADVTRLQADSLHVKVTCEVCHGPSMAHALTPTTHTDRTPSPTVCLRCHEANPSRPRTFKQIEVASHAGDQKCTECHNPHSPMEDPS